MNDYPSIDDFLTEGQQVSLGKEAEHEIIQYMEVYAQSVDNNETEAFTNASSIVLNC